MASKRKRSFSAFILDMVLLVPHVMRIVRHTTDAIRLEVQLAVKNIVVIVALGIISLLLLITTWLGLLALLFLYLTTYIHWSNMISLTFVLAINILFFMAIMVVMTKKKRNLVLSKAWCEQLCVKCKNLHR